jgi:S-DNA-T family DNA segregation ATPase FtsK/SpoIIIE
MTRSVFALAFAALGPVVAVASAADARLQHRRTSRREAVRFDRDRQRVRSAIEGAHEIERQELDRASPTAAALLVDLDHDPRRWSLSLRREVRVRIGSGAIASGLDYEAGESDDPEIDESLDELRRLALSVPNAPIVADAVGGIGLVGPRYLTVAVARGLVLQLAIGFSPATTVLTGLDALTDEAWLAALPHARSGGGGSLVFCPVLPGSVLPGSVFPGSALSEAAAGGASSDGQGVRIALASRAADLPRELAVVVELGGDGIGRIIRGPGQAVESLNPEFVSRETASAAATALADRAILEGVRRPETTLRDSLRFADLPAPSAVEPAGLLGAIGMSEGGPVSVDLAVDGPHAIVGGTTGSGKSQLLLTWILAMAASRGPDRVTFLFVDFKGGAAFDPMRTLPHCVGVITDLDATESVRALSSLTAELRHRERQLAQRGLRSLDEADGVPPFPRLVVVVDEYAALVDGNSGLHAVFSDVAARGRSLGVHLVLCTQRPSGVVRDGILANCALRLSLRVTSAADSVAVVGTDEAATLPARPLGRALMSIAGAPPRLLQIAHSTQADIDAVVDRWGGSSRPRAPWLPPLPALIPLRVIDDAPPGAGIPFAMMDLPERQLQEIARYDPQAHGSLLVVGAGTSGKSGVLDTLAGAASTLECTRVASGLPALWDALTVALGSPDGVNDGVGEGRAPRILLLDDVDAVVASSPEDYQAVLLDLLARLLREGPAFGQYAVVTAQRLTGQLHSLTALCGSRLVLKLPNRAEHVAAGGETDEFVPGLSPGGGHWHGARVQVLRASAISLAPAPLLATDVDLRTDRLAAVSSQPERFAETLRRLEPGRRLTLLGDRRPGESELEISRGGVQEIPIADPEQWQAQWSLLGSARRNCSLLFDGCSLAELRSLTRVRELPPPFPRGERPLWLLSPDGELGRARLTSGN